MFEVFQILVTRRVAPLALALIGVVALAGCGQKGRLYLPQGEAAKDRATLPEIIRSTTPAAAAASTPAPVTPTGQANPAPRQ